jgi:hypothetical protein
MESLKLILLIILSFYRQRVSATLQRAQAITILCQDVTTTEDAPSRLGVLLGYWATSSHNLLRAPGDGLKF